MKHPITFKKDGDFVIKLTESQANIILHELHIIKCLFKKRESQDSVREFFDFENEADVALFKEIVTEFQGNIQRQADAVIDEDGNNLFESNGLLKALKNMLERIDDDR